MTKKGATKAALVVAILFGSEAAFTHAAIAQSKAASVPGVTVEATAKPIRWFGLIPASMVQFDLAIYVDRSVRPFSTLRYECLFVNADGGEVGLASRGAATREAFTVMEGGRLVSRLREELANHGPAYMRCRATKLEK